MQQVLVVCPTTKTITVVDSDNTYQFMNSKIKHPALDKIKQPWIENYAKLMYRAGYMQDTIFVEMYANCTALMIPGKGFNFTADANVKFRVNGVACFIIRDQSGRVHKIPDSLITHINSLVSFVNPQYNSQQAEVLAMMRATIAHSKQPA
ncbi:hypothetical protein [Aeromonas salmonicida]|uniref:hypothetical protein n=1 Tax=Aeromonas salmonicida TaxID=645 RepID=UPI003D1BE0D6